MKHIIFAFLIMASCNPCYAWKQDGNYIVVAEGDSLSAIAINLNIEFSEFMRKCDTYEISNHNLIYPNQRINCSEIFDHALTSTVDPIMLNDDNAISEDKTIDALRDMQKKQEQSNIYLNRIVNIVELSDINNISKQLSPISGKIGETNALIKNGFSSLEEKIAEGPDSNFFLGIGKWVLAILAGTISTLLFSYFFTDDMTSNNSNKN